MIRGVAQGANTSKLALYPSGEMGWGHQVSVSKDSRLETEGGHDDDAMSHGVERCRDVVLVSRT